MRFTECFYSLQGEGRYVGVPSVFLRLFGCNLRCPSFGVRNRQEVNPEVQEIIKNMDQYKKFEDLPLVHTGCDTYASVYPQFKRFAQDATPEELTTKIIDLIKHKGETHLVITGGEPLLLGNQSNLISLLFQLAPWSISDVTFETNGTQPLKPETSQRLKELSSVLFDFTFSVSPKLSSSGENVINTIIPRNIIQYQEIAYTYLKFVITSPDDLPQVQQVVKQYKDAGFKGPVYLMPAGGRKEEYLANREMVAKLCTDNGFRYSPRLHVDIYGNSWGT